MKYLLAPVYLDTLAHLRTVDQNAPSIQNVLVIKLVFVKGVKIHVPDLAVNRHCVV